MTAVVVDTSVWSLAFRRQQPVAAEAEALGALIRDGAAIMVGAVRQELLSGIREPVHFRALRDLLRKHPDYPLTTAHYEMAAEAFNLCRAKGVQGSDADFLLCAVSQLDRLAIYTTDQDFGRYAKHLPIKLYRPL